MCRNLGIARLVARYSLDSCSYPNLSKTKRAPDVIPATVMYAERPMEFCLGSRGYHASILPLQPTPGNPFLPTILRISITPCPAYGKSCLPTIKESFTVRRIETPPPGS